MTQTAKSTVILWTSSARKRQVATFNHFFSSAVVAPGALLINFNVHLLQNSEHNRSLDDLDEEESHVLPPLGEPHATQETQEDIDDPPQVIRCGGEDGETGGTMSQRQRVNADMPDGSLVRRGRGEVVLVERLYSKNLVLLCSAHDILF